MLHAWKSTLKHRLPHTGGLLFLFNRKAVRFFRKDGHEWRKKTDGKTVRETHEKLKVSSCDNGSGSSVCDFATSANWLSQGPCSLCRLKSLLPLQIGNKEVLNCYYAHSEAQEALQASTLLHFWPPFVLLQA